MLYFVSKATQGGKVKQETLAYVNNSWENPAQSEAFSNEANIVFIFGDREVFKQEKPYEEIKALYPHAHIVGCTSSGNILGDKVSKETMVATAVSFESGRVALGVEDFTQKEDLVEVGKRAVSKLPPEGLKHIFILSDGLNMNGSSLVQGANQAVNNAIPITGGLAGDGIDFEETWVIADEAARQNRVVAIGFYGESISVSSGCFAGWDEFGILRKITRSEGNIVYEIDGEPALQLYKKYLGEYADKLPGSGLRFPMGIKEHKEDVTIIRTVLSVDEQAQSLIFAGDVPQGYLARLMKSSVNGVIDASQIVASRIAKTNTKNALGLVVSCVGRRMILNQLTNEELECISETLGENVQLTGFYSYGELAPFFEDPVSCQFHNQTMTLTVIYENGRQS